MSLTLPSPADYPNGGFLAAYREYEIAQQADRDAELLSMLGSIGARTVDCPCGYTPFDTCPNHD